MKKSEIRAKAKKHIAEKNILKVHRELEGEDLGCYGFLLDVSADFLVVQIDSDFQLDGYTIVPISTVADITCNKADRFHKSILRKEGVIKRDHGLDHKLDLSDWSSVFKSLKAKGAVVSIEDETDEEIYYVIGRIIRVNKKSVAIQYFDALGQLDKETTKVNYEDITIVNFDSRYINTYAKHLKEPKK